MTATNIDGFVRLVDLDNGTEGSELPGQAGRE